MTDRETDDATDREPPVEIPPKPTTTANTDLSAATVLGAEDAVAVAVAVTVSESGPVDDGAKPKAIDLQPGELLGKYEVRRKLGAGAMGAVYLAFDPMIQREVAVKVLPSDIAARPQALDRFLTEARATGKLNHPHVVAIYDIGVDDDRHFIVMEVLRGGSILELVESSGPLPWRDACRVIADAADGLAAAHAAGLFHRDIKPENLMRTAEGVVKIVDFGLAKLHDAAGDVQMAVTRMGQVMGTPQFMSPEQFEGTSVDHRCDIYSLGGTLYQLLTGRFPYEGAQTIVQLMYQHLQEPPPDPTLVNSEIPTGCRDIIARAMAKAPGDRYQDIAEFARDLRELLQAGSADAAAPAPTPTIENWQTLRSVCIVEPSRMQAMMLRDCLTRAGVESIRVHDRAATAISEDAPGADVVVTSMVVPDMSGSALIEAMRNDQRFRQAMLILNSSDSTIADLINAGRTGVLALVSKKTKPEEILRAVHACSWFSVPTASFDRPIDAMTLRVLIVCDSGQLPPAIANLIRAAGLLDIVVATPMDLAAGAGPHGRFDLAVVLRTAGDAAGDTQLYAELLSQIAALKSLEVKAVAAARIDGERTILRALACGGFSAVTKVPLDETRLTRILQITS